MILVVLMAAMCRGDDGSPSVVRNLEGLAAAASGTPRNLSVELEGAVLWSSRAEGRVILHDDSNTLLLELQFPCEMPKQGDQLRLDGKCAVVRSRDAVLLAPVPVVENNGLHALEEHSGTVRLESGKHPIRVVWFTRTGEYGLEVKYEGPGIPRQIIPASDLFRREAGSYVNGLDFRCVEGQWWRLLPNFDHLPAVRSGVAEYFDLNVRTRDSHVGLQFDGFINIPRSGDYTFFVRSDDGSRLFIGPSSLKVSSRRDGALPRPMPVSWHGVSPDDPEFQWSEIEGSVVSVQPSSGTLNLEIMTEAGRVRIQVADAAGDIHALRPHNRIRAVGVSRRIRNLNGQWVRGRFFVQSLDNLTLHAAPAVGTAGRDLPLLTTIDQVYKLGHEESARRYPVKVRGVITSPMEDNGAVLQDSSRGIYVALGGPVNLQVGDFCEIEGTTGPYQFSQYIEASRVEVLGAGVLPQPVTPSWDQLINGSLHCNYVVLEGVVISVGNHQVTLLTRGGRINVRLNSLGPAVTQDVLGATVRLRGCLLADWDGESMRVVIGSIYLDQQNVTVVHPAPTDPFAIESKRVSDLLQFDPEAGALQRVRVSGVLIHKGPDLCCLMDHDSGLRFVPAHEVDAGIGDRVDVVGFLELGGPAAVLREATVRKIETSAMPEARRLAPDRLLQDEYDSMRVKIKGVLLDRHNQAGRVVLELQTGLRRFMAEVSGNSAVQGLTPGSLLELTGVYIGQGGDRVLGRPIDSFKLLLNTDADITVLSQPSWWTLRRMLNVVSLLAAVLVVALIWIKLLRRQVAQRTVELGSQIRQRQRAEHLRQIEQERARVAHDLHDDLGARITEVNMLASLVKSPGTDAEERKKYAEELSDIALHMVTSLDEIVWAVNPRNDTMSSLTAYFGAYAQRFLELASIGCGLDMAECKIQFPLGTRFRRQVFLAFKEALSNVVQHADAKKVWLRIFVENNDLVVEVADDGRGFMTGAREAGADGQFNMKKRLEALGGQCTVESEPGQGTTVRLRVPLQGSEE